MFAFCQDTTISDVLYVSFGSALWTTFTSRTLKLFISCFNRRVKRFFGFAKYDSVTDMFANLFITNAQSRLLGVNFNFANKLWRCHNPLARLLDSLSTYGVNND